MNVKTLFKMLFLNLAVSPALASENLNYFRVQIPLTSWNLPAYASTSLPISEAPIGSRALFNIAFGTTFKERFGVELNLATIFFGHVVQGFGRYYLVKSSKVEMFAGAGAAYHSYHTFYSDDQSNHYDGPAIVAGFGAKYKFSKDFGLVSQIFLNTMFANFESKSTYASNPTTINSILIFPTLELIGLEWMF